jgi:hypothetical protein
VGEIMAVETAKPESKTGTLLTEVNGVIRRRILLNYAADPAVVQSLLPAPFHPKLHAGKAIVGVCLIRLEQMRPHWLPPVVGMSSENAAHRMAVEWTGDNGETREGVYIPRRDTGSWFNHLVGGRLFPGDHHKAEFQVKDTGDQIAFAMISRDKTACLELKAAPGAELPTTSIFASLAEASTFFEGGCDGFSPRHNSTAVDGLRLCVGNWLVTPLTVEYARSAFYNDERIFPKGSIKLDHALLMRDISHRWESVGGVC